MLVLDDQEELGGVLWCFGKVRWCASWKLFLFFWKCYLVRSQKYLKGDHRVEKINNRVMNIKILLFSDFQYVGSRWKKVNRQLKPIANDRSRKVLIFILWKNWNRISSHRERAYQSWGEIENSNFWIEDKK